MISQNAGRILPESERTNRHGSADVSHSSDADAGYGQIAFWARGGIVQKLWNNYVLEHKSVKECNLMSGFFCQLNKKC